MHYVHMYTGPDGLTHFRDVDVPLAAAGPHAALSQPFPAESIVFRTSQPEMDMDWHNAPRRQFLVTLAGEAEIEASDGEVRRMRVGDVVLADDLTGKGHITRGAGTTPRLSLIIPVP